MEAHRLMLMGRVHDLALLQSAVGLARKVPLDDEVGAHAAHKVHEDALGIGPVAAPRDTFIVARVGNEARGQARIGDVLAAEGGQCYLSAVHSTIPVLRFQPC
ncbi:MAG: hypothetical protein AB7W28_12230 [Armatimonadota bacterium]